MCFLPRIFNYDIICSHNTTFLDSHRQNKNYCPSLLIAPADWQADLWPPGFTARPQLQPGLAPPRLRPLVGLQAGPDWPRPPPRGPEDPPGGRSRLHLPLWLACAPDTPGVPGRGHWLTRLGQAGPDIALNVIKENLKHFKPFRVFYYLMMFDRRVREHKRKTWHGSQSWKK